MAVPDLPYPGVCVVSPSISGCHTCSLPAQPARGPAAHGCSHRGAEKRSEEARAGCGCLEQKQADSNTYAPSSGDPHAACSGSYGQALALRASAGPRQQLSFAKRKGQK